MRLLAVTLLFGVSSCMLPATVQAAETGTYEAAIWIDPDGCEHWVLDLGVEGMMPPHLDRAGNSVCDRNPYICIEFPGDMLFEVNKAALSDRSINTLHGYFTREILDGKTQFLIVGHTDSSGSIYDNFDLAWARANAVADVARQSGAIVRTDGFGEMQPIASNDTAEGRRRNRRVEILCE
ncbi:MAG: OmpA family protein [Paracoccaceae bacterium]|jgi:flagellar motor protein MotB